MTTAFSAITAAFVARLEADPPVAEKITRADRRRVEDETEQAVNVQFDGAVPEAGAIKGAPVDWQSRIIVECKVRSSSTTGDVAVDYLLQTVYARLAADTTLGGLVEDIGVPIIESAYDAQGQKTGWMQMTYTVLHRTTENTLE